MAKAQWELDAVARFLAFYNQERGLPFTAVGEDVVVDLVLGTNYDFELATGDGGVPPVAFEVFRLIDSQADLASRQIWSQIVDMLQDEMDARGLKGYLVRTPSFSVPKFRRAQYAKEQANLLEQAIKNNAGVKTFHADGYELTAIEGLPAVRFSSFSSAMYIDPSGRALTALRDKLPDKNNQLNVAGHERTVLVINWNFPIPTDDVIEACSQIDFTSLPNIDRIYFESTPGRHSLVFDRTVFEDLCGQRPASNPALEPLYIKWLSSGLARRDQAAFTLAKRLIDERGPLFLPEDARQSVVLYGEQFVADSRWDDAEWIVRTFRDDPSPSLTNQLVDGEERLSYHNRVRQGDDVGIIAFVRAHVAWLVQQIVCAPKRDLYPLMIDTVGRFLDGEDLYVRQQAAIPLIELTIRRYRTHDGQRFMNDESAEQVRRLALRLLRGNAAYPRVLDVASRVFVWMHDFSEEEFREVFETLVNTGSDDAIESAADILVYYALFRQQENDRFGPFDQTWAKARLAQATVQGPGKLRSQCTWIVGRLLKEERVELAVVLDYMAGIPCGPYDRWVFSQFYRALDDYATTSPVGLGTALLEAFRREREYCLGDPQRVVWHLESAWRALEKLAATGEEQVVVHCIATITDYLPQIRGGTAVPMIRELLRNIADQNLKAEANRLLAALANP